MKGYKKIPKRLRREYNKAGREVFFKAVKAFFIFPIIYKRSRELFAMGRPEENRNLRKSHIYWLYDCTEHVDGDPSKPLDYIACTYGDKNYRERKGFDYDKASKLGRYWAAFRWLVLRNSAYNLKASRSHRFDFPYTSYDVLDLEGPAHPLNWRDKNDVGLQSVIIYLENGEVIFRYSYTLPLGKLNPFRLLGYKWKNRMRGADKNGYKYKNRLFKELN